jgi:DNA-binding response OmpR family regulator
MTSKGTILVVEDDKDSREALCTMLESLGYTPVAFGDPTEVIEGLDGKELDLALLDIMMPKLNGYELLQEIKKLDTYADLPVIMVTAKDQDSEILEGYQYGADYYITKPFTTKQLEYGIRIFLT